MKDYRKTTENTDWLIEQGSTKHIIGHIGTGFYGSNETTNSVKALKEDKSPKD